MIERVKKVAWHLFAADTRSLAAFRIALGVVLAVDTLDRLEDLKAFYTDFGVLPGDLFRAKWPRAFTFHDKVPDVWQLPLMLGVIVSAIAFAAGWRTRYMAALLWTVVRSQQARNNHVLQGGDSLLLLLLFWSIFAPVGLRWSLDARRRAREGGPSPPDAVLAPGVLALQAQVIILYFFAALHKSGFEWRYGTAVYFALSIDAFVTPIGVWLRGMPALLKPLSFFTFWLEAAAPLLLWCPLLALRAVGVAAFVALHVGFGSCLYLGTFPFIDSASLMLFLPAAFWDKFRVPRAGGPPWRPRRLDRVAQPVAALLLACVLVWNAATVHQRQRSFPGWFRHSTGWLGLHQQWSMFAPYPLKRDGWYVIPARLKDGSVVDLFRDGAPVDWSRPPRIAEMYRNHRWRKYLLGLWQGRDRVWHIKRYAEYLCREWNARHASDRHVEELEIYVMEEVTRAHMESPVNKVRFIRHRCGEGRVEDGLPWAGTRIPRKKPVTPIDRALL